MGAPRALVTGCSSGIGAAVVNRLLAEGWEVVGISRSTPPPRAGARWISADLTDVSAVPAALADVDHLHAVVHAAGVQRSARLGSLSPADGALMWRLHVDAATAVVDAVIDRVCDGGRIVLMGSRTATGVAGKSQYAATKAALVGLTRSWAMELAERRVTVNVVAPGPTDTPMLGDPGRAATPPQPPALGRFIRPAEVAALTAFLLGPDGGMITGQQLVMCGGASLGLLPAPRQGLPEHLRGSQGVATALGVSIEEAVVVVGAPARDADALLAKRLLVRQEVGVAALRTAGLASTAWTASTGHRADWRLVLTPTGR